MSASIAALECKSPAAREAFLILKEATKQEYRVWGDTKTAARDRAAENAGVTPAQAERLWKNWQTTKYPNADVYRLLRNTYGHLCTWVENAADGLDAARREIEEANATDQGHRPAVAGVAQAAQGEERTMRR